jgi:hypothetical protein
MSTPKERVGLKEPPGFNSQTNAIYKLGNKSRGGGVCGQKTTPARTALAQKSNVAETLRPISLVGMGHVELSRSIQSRLLRQIAARAHGFSG